MHIIAVLRCGVLFGAIMNCKHISFLIIASTLLALSFTSAYAVSNGGFELFEPNEFLGFNVPLFWNIENCAAVVNHFTPNPTQGFTTNWKIDLDIGLAPAQGDVFLVLNNGPRDINFAEASQQIVLNEGDTISGFYFFGTCDYITPDGPPKYNDYGKIDLIPEPNQQLDPINVAYQDVINVGNYSSMEGWERFDYTINLEQIGSYRLVLTVVDVEDTIYESYLLTDGITVCNPAYPGDLYIDCKVDFTDFALFANDWQINCGDPNFAYDPNYNCYRGTDLTGNGMVDTEDLAIFVDSWLGGCD